jgi:hypothetical protein
MGRLPRSYESWSVTLREVYRLRVFENCVRRKTFGLEREEVTGIWRKVQSKELYDLNSSPNTSQILEDHPTLPP